MSRNPAPLIDHTLLKPEANSAMIRQLCEEAVEYGFAAVCVPPAFVSPAAEILYGSEVAVATVVGFPLGYSSPETKVFEAMEAVRKGAGEIDMVIHWGAALEGRIATVEEEIRKVVRAAEGACVKVILECCSLDDALKATLTESAAAAGAAFVKTSTGFGAAGATVADVRLLAQVSAGRMGVKAAGGIRDIAVLREMTSAGATRIGTSAGVKIMEEWRREMGC